MQSKQFKKGSFVKSVVSFKQKPDKKFPEIAFAGRSNVGKSSLLNALLGTKKLAKISSTPGKTRQINYFIINESFYFVDLPGYGYAKLAKSEKKKWQALVETYLLKSMELRLVVLLIDSRHDLMDSDQQMIDWLDLNEIPYIVVLTKADKLAKTKRQKTLNKWSKDLPDHHVKLFSVSLIDTIEELSLYLTNFSF